MIEGRFVLMKSRTEISVLESLLGSLHGGAAVIQQLLHNAQKCFPFIFGLLYILYHLKHSLCTLYRSRESYRSVQLEAKVVGILGFHPLFIELVGKSSNNPV